MALEIIIEHNLEDNEFVNEMKIVSSTVEEELTGREKDSGNWSVDYKLTDVESENRSSLSPNSDPDSSDSEDDAVSIKEHEEMRNIPTPPPLPPIGGTIGLWKREELQIVCDINFVDGVQSNQIPIAPPPPPLKQSLQLSAPASHEIEEVDESKCCIVCYDPNQVTEYDDFDYDMYMEVHRCFNSHINIPCCGRLVCKPCMNAIISSIVGEGRVQVSCPHPECGKPFTKAYITSNISDEDVKKKYQQFLVDVENDGKRKTCPKCCHITEHQLPKRIRLQEKDLKIDCEVCHQEWCFRCHAPWHTGISCRQFQKGSKEFRKWTKGKQRGVANCQKCPTCRVYIQRSTGCHHMQCNRCDTDFCYDCGGRFLELGIIDHESTLNVWGCPDNYLKDEPIKRNAVRWGYLTAKLSYLAAYPPLLIGACGLLVIGAAIVVPIYAGFKIHSYSKFRRQAASRRRN